MSGMVTRRWLFIEMTVRRRPPLPLWSVHLTKQTEPARYLILVVHEAATVFKEDFPHFSKGVKVFIHG